MYQSLTRPIVRAINRLPTVRGFAKAVEQVVEYVRNGTFDVSATQWNGGNSASLVVVDGQMRLTAKTNPTPFMYQVIELTAGTTYRLKVDVVEAYRTAIRVGTGVGSGNIINSDTINPRQYEGTFVATQPMITVSVLALEMAEGAYAVIDNISITEVIA